jgi:hypothetical protein
MARFHLTCMILILLFVNKVRQEVTIKYSTTKFFLLRSVDLDLCDCSPFHPDLAILPIWVKTSLLTSVQTLKKRECYSPSCWNVLLNIWSFSQRWNAKVGAYIWMCHSEMYRQQLEKSFGNSPNPNSCLFVTCDLRLGFLAQLST